MRSARWTAIVVAAWLAVACSAGPGSGSGSGSPPTTEALPPGVVLVGADIARDTAPPVPPGELATLVRGSNQLGTDLYRLLAAEGTGNLLLSPTSISIDLAMVYAGARGTTADEMKAALHLDLPADRVPPTFDALDLALLARNRDKVELAAANKLWGQKGLAFLAPFVDTMSRWYGAPIATTDFGADPEAARAAINAWAAERTHDRIPELFPAGTIAPNTRLVLANSVYLNAEWHFPFNDKLTRDAPFQKLDGSTAQVPTMQFNEYLPTAHGDSWSAVEIPYAGMELSMVVIVPQDLRAFEAGLDAARLADVFAKLKDGGIHLSLPRWSFSYHTSLVKPLQSLGMRSAFGDADFSGMTQGGGLFVSAVEHATFVKVDEKGTEAAAATGTGMKLSHGPTIAANRPFVFAIRDKATGAVLFLGRVTDPTAP